MKILLLLYVSINLFASSSDELETVRKQFPNINSLEQADEFIAILENDKSPEALGYTAVMNFMKSRFVNFPFTKLKYFKVGKKELDNVINNHPENIEIRYLRFLMQKEIPGFLGYNENINEDFNTIVNGVKKSNLNATQKSKMLNNMLQTKDLTSNQKQQLNQLLNTI